MNWYECVGALTSAVSEVEQAVGKLVDDETTADVLVGALADVREQRVALAFQEAVLESAAARAMKSDRLEAPGLVAERRGGTTRRAWDSDRLSSRIVSALYVDSQTGEVDPTALDLVETTRKTLLEYAAIDRWRVTALRAKGIYYSDCCESTPSRRTVHVKRAVEGGAA